MNSDRFHQESVFRKAPPLSPEAAVCTHGTPQALGNSVGDVWAGAAEGGRDHEGPSGSEGGAQPSHGQGSLTSTCPSPRHPRELGMHAGGAGRMPLP